MACSLNKAIIVGNPGADPDIRQSSDGKSFAPFTVATSESRKEMTTGNHGTADVLHRVATVGLQDQHSCASQLPIR